MKRLVLIILLTVMTGLAGIYGIGGCGGGADNVNPDPSITPSVIATNPENGAVDVAPNINISAVFNEQVDPQTVSSQTFYLREGDNNVPGTVSSNELVVSFTPAEELKPMTQYTATLTTAIESLKELPLENDYSWSFTTGGEPDTRGPVVVSTMPYDYESDVGHDTEITVTFDEAVDPSTLTNQTFIVEDQSGVVSGSVSLDAAGVVATFTPASDLTRDRDYSVTLKKEISDLSGNIMENDYKWSFATDPAFYVSNSGDNDNIGSGKNPWQTIQYAIDHVSNGDIIKVAAGTYSEAQTIEINKSLELIGENRNTTFIDPPANIGTHYYDQAIIDVAGSNDNSPENIVVEISGFTIDAARTPNLKFAVFLRGGAYAIVRNNIISGAMPAAGDVNSGNLAVGWADFGYKAHALIENNTITDFHSFGIAVYGPGNAATIRGNAITGNPDMHICSNSPGTYAGAMGIVVQNAVITVITNNTISDMKRNPTCPPASFDSAIELYWAGDMLVTGNVIENNDYGFGSYNAYGPNGSLIMDGNSFTDNQIGVQFGNITVTSCKNNNIEGNAIFGMKNNMASVVDARNNWWGSDTGPTHQTNPGGTGDTVSDNVNFNPWKTAP